MKIYFLLLVLLQIFISDVQGQNRPKVLDKIIQKDYTVIEGKILRVSEKEVEYSTLGSTVVYSLAVSKIVRVQFANGTTKEFPQEQSITTTTTTKDIVTTPKEEAKPVTEKKVTKNEIRANTVAVLPLVFVNTATLQKSADMSKFAQNDMYSKLIDKSANIFPLTVQDLRLTNSLLRKAGMDYNNIDEITIEELRDVLGVDHIIAGKVAYTTRTSVSNNSSSSTNVSTDKHGVEANTYNDSFSESDVKYDYVVYLDLYRNTDKIYSKSREPVLAFKDSWMDSMSYLLKRCPIYTK